MDKIQLKLTKSIFSNDHCLFARFTLALFVFRNDPEAILSLVLQTSHLECELSEQVFLEDGEASTKFILPFNDEVGDGASAIISGWGPGEG